MSPSRFQRIKAIVLALWELPESERAAELERACAGDDELRASVLELMAAEEGGDAFVLDEPLPRQDVLAAADELTPHEEGLRGAFEPDSQLGEFRIVRLLAKGGMGHVYEAEQGSPRRRVAIKVLRRSWGSDELQRRFEREAEVLGALHHAGIAQVYSSGTVELDGETHPYIAMELVDGTSLTEHAHAQRLDTAARLTLLARVADAVQHAHDRGVVHRDLKPQNILVGTDGAPKVLDFGIARLTGSDVQSATLLTEVGQVLGTLPYMSPEQVSGDTDAVDERSDVYALGVLLYELLGGRRPLEFGQAGVPEAMRRILDEEPTRLGLFDSRLRGDIETIVGKALEKDARRRYASAAALADDIRRHLGHEPIAAHPPSAIYQVRKFARRHRGLVGGLVLAVLALVAGLAVAVRFGAREAEQRAAAEAMLQQLTLEAAAAAWDRGRPVMAREWLERTPPARRGWEWQHLAARLQSAQWRVPALQAVLAPGEPALHQMKDGAPRVAFSADGTGIIGFRDARSVVVWERASGRERLAIPSDVPWVRGVMSVQGSRLALADANGHVRVHDLGDGRELGRTAPAGDVRAVALHADGTRLAVVRALDETRDGIWIGPLDDLRLISEQDVRLFDLRWRPAGEQLVFSFENADPNLAYRAVLDVPSGEVVLRDRVSLNDFDLALDGTNAAGTRSRQVVVGPLTPRPEGNNDAPIGPDQRTYPGHELEDIRAVALTPDGTRIASATDRALIVFDVASGEQLVQHALPAGLLADIAFAPDGRQVAVHLGDGVALYACEPSSGRVLAGHPSYVYWVDVAPDGQSLLSHGLDAHTRLWDPFRDEALAAWDWDVADWRKDPPGVWELSEKFMAWHADGDRGVVWYQGSVGELDPWVDDDWRVLEHGEGDNSGSKPWWTRWPELVGSGVSSHGYVVSPDGGVGLNLRHASLHDARSGATTGQLEGVPAYHWKNAYLALNRTASFAPSGQRMVVAASGVSIHDRHGRLLQRLEGHRGEVYAAAWSPDGTRIATGGNDTTVRIWDADSLEQLLVLDGHEQYVHDLAWAPDGSWLVSASGDRTLRVWDSVSRRVRHDAERAEDDLAAELAPRVRGLLDEGLPPAEVAARLRGAADLDAAGRRAALGALRRALDGG